MASKAINLPRPIYAAIQKKAASVNLKPEQFVARLALSHPDGVPIKTSGEQEAERISFEKRQESGRCPECKNVMPRSWIFRAHRVFGFSCKGVQR